MLLLAAEPHHILDSGAVVPTAVEYDDFARRRKACQVTLHVKLGFLTIGGRGQRHHAEHARADALRNGLDRTAFPCAVPTLKYQDDSLAGMLYPRLQPAQFDLQLAQGLLVFLSAHLLPGRSRLLLHAEPSVRMMRKSEL